MTKLQKFANLAYHLDTFDFVVLIITPHLEEKWLTGHIHERSMGIEYQSIIIWMFTSSSKGLNVY